VARGAVLGLIAILADPAMRGGARPRCHLAIHPAPRDAPLAGVSVDALLAH